MIEVTKNETRSRIAMPWPPSWKMDVKAMSWVVRCGWNLTGGCSLAECHADGDTHVKNIKTGSRIPTRRPFVFRNRKVVLSWPSNSSCDLHRLRSAVFLASLPSLQHICCFITVLLMLYIVMQVTPVWLVPSILWHLIVASLSSLVTVLTCWCVTSSTARSVSLSTMIVPCEDSQSKRVWLSSLVVNSLRCSLMAKWRLMGLGLKCQSRSVTPQSPGLDTWSELQTTGEELMWRVIYLMTTAHKLCLGESTVHFVMRHTHCNHPSVGSSVHLSSRPLRACNSKSYEVEI